MDETRRKEEGRGDYYVLSTHTLLGVGWAFFERGIFVCLSALSVKGTPFCFFSLFGFERGNAV